MNLLLADGVIVDVLDENVLVIKPICSEKMKIRFCPSIQDAIKKSIGEFVCIEVLAKDNFDYKKECDFTLLNISFSGIQIDGPEKERSVISLYKDGLLSSGQSAKILGMTRIEFWSFIEKNIGYVFCYSGKE